MAVTEAGVTYCSRCSMPHTAEPVGESILICSNCGQVDSPYGEKQATNLKKRFIVLATVLSMAMLTLFGLTLDWGSHSLKVIPLKTMQFLGLASDSQLKTVADICKERGKADCVEKALGQITERNEDLEFLAQYGKILSLNSKNLQAIQNFEKYFARGGNNPDAAYEYAKVLSRAGKNDLATKYFEKVLTAKPDTMQITVSKAYVDHLIKINQLSRAKRFILNWRSKGSNTGYFLERRWRKINSRLASH